MKLRTQDERRNWKGPGLGNAPYTEGTTWDIWRDERGRHSNSASEVYGGEPPRAAPPGLRLALSTGVVWTQKQGLDQGGGEGVQDDVEAKEMGMGISAFCSTMCLWPALPIGLGMWRVLMSLPQIGIWNLLQFPASGVLASLLN